VTIIDNKTIATVVIAGAIAGAVSSWLVMSVVPPAEDAGLATTLAAIEARIARLEAESSIVEPLPVLREAELTDVSIGEPAARAREIDQHRPITGRPEMLELFDAGVDAEVRRARAHEILDSPIGPARFMAIRVLAELGDPVVADAVRNLVDESDTDERMQRLAAGAVDLLGSIEGAAVDVQLYDYLNHEYPEVRISAARQLEVRGDDNPMVQIVDELALGLDDADTGARSRAAQALGRTQSASAVTPLTRALQDESVEVRLRAVEGLGMTGSQVAVPVLTATLEDPVAELRSAAARSLDRIRNPSRTGLRR
jgi:hypothetical protein